MHDASPLWLVLAAVLAVAGMGCLALAMPSHAVQVLGRMPAAAQRRCLRIAGAVALASGLASCLMADHPSMAVLVWVMLLAAAAVAVALLLARAPRWLAVVAVPRPGPVHGPGGLDGRGGRRKPPAPPASI